MANGNGNGNEAVKKDSPLLSEIKSTNLGILSDMQSGNIECPGHAGLTKGIGRLFHLVEMLFKQVEASKDYDTLRFKVLGIPMSIDTKDPFKTLVGLMIVYMFLNHIGVLPAKYRISFDAPHTEIEEKIK